MRFVRQSLIALVSLVLLWAGLSATHWLPFSTDVQRKSQAILAAPPLTAKGSRNAFAAIWLSHFDIPALEIERVAHDDVERFLGATFEQRVKFVTSAHGRYRKQDLDAASQSALCMRADGDCLARMRSNPELARKTLDDHALLLANALAMEGDDYYHDEFTSQLSPAVPRYSLIGLLRSDAALRFVDGKQADGLRRACSAAASSRRLALHSDESSTQAMESVGFVASTQMIADMLAEMPKEAPLPAICAEAFAPMSDAALSICDSMKAEFHARADLMRPPGSIGARLLFNDRATFDAMAPAFASYCSDDAALQQAVRRTETSLVFWRICGIDGVLFNYAGCTLAEMGDPRRMTAGLVERLRNMQRINRLMDAALDMRLPGWSWSTSHFPEGVWTDLSHVVGDAGTSKSPRFTIPVPASRLR